MPARAAQAASQPATGTSQPASGSQSHQHNAVATQAVNRRLNRSALQCPAVLVMASDALYFAAAAGCTMLLCAGRCIRHCSDQVVRDETVPLAGPPDEVRVYDERAVEHCINRLVETDDGGDTCLDCQPATDVTVSTLTAQQTGFRSWQRNGSPRGSAIWAVPSGRATSASLRPGRILYLHGGAYTRYAPTDPCYVSIVTRLAQLSGMCVLAIDYGLAPENVFPTAVDDAVAALNWLNNHSGPIWTEGPCNAPVFVVGDSAGGGLSAALALRAANDATITPAIAGIALISPWLDLTASGTSVQTEQWDPKTRTGDPVFQSNDGNWIQTAGTKYCGVGNERHPEASPLRAPTLRGFPPCLVQVGDAELIRSDSIEFVKRLRDDGVNAELEVWPRMWHCFHMYAEGCGGLGPSAAPCPLREAEVATERIARFFCAL